MILAQNVNPQRLKKSCQLLTSACTQGAYRLFTSVILSRSYHHAGQQGFTLIELLIVVVIIGILAAIAIPKFSATREKAYFAAMKSDLKNLASQQEIYYSDEYSYTGNVTSLGFVQSDGVVITPTGHLHRLERDVDARRVGRDRGLARSTMGPGLRWFLAPPYRGVRVRWPARNKAGLSEAPCAFGRRAWLGAFPGPRSLSLPLQT